MGLNFATRPADQALVTGKRGGIYYVGEALTFTFSKPAGLGTPATPDAWQVRDITGTVVRSGTAPGSTLTVTPALNPGWYKLYLKRTVADATWGTNQGEYHFAVFRNTSGFPSRPSGSIDGNSRNDLTDRGGFSDADAAVRGLTLSSMQRYQINTPASPAAELTVAQGMQTLDAAYWRAFDTSRTKYEHCHFPGIDTSNSAHLAGVTTVVSALGPIWYGAFNEPDNGGITAAAYVGQLQTFYNTVKAANPNAKVMGPTTVGINNGGSYAWLDAFFAAGGGAYCDGIAFHDYNSLNGDLALARTVYDRFVALLTTYGQQNKLRFMTEWGTFAATYGAFTPRRQARWWGMALLVWEQYGIPKEQVCDFYQVAHGFDSFPSHNQTFDLSPYPVVVLRRVYSEEVYGKSHALRLDFGTVENKHYVGSRFDGADGTKVLVMLSQGLTDGRATVTVTGARTLTLVDTWGNSSTLTVNNGQVTVPITETPCYLRLPVGATATLVPVVYGRNVAHDRQAATAASSGGTSAAKIVNLVDDSYYDRYATADAAFLEPAANLPTTPATVTVTLGKQTTFDTVIVRCPPPWQNQGSLLDFDLQYLASDGSTWTTLATVNEPINQLSIVSDYYLGHGGYTETYWSERHTFRFDLGQQITSTAVRLYVRACSKGGEVGTTDTTQYGQGNPSSPGQNISIREIEVYNVRQANVTQYLTR